MKKISINPFEKPLASYFSYQKYMKIIGFVFLLIPQISNATFGTVLYNYNKEFDLKWDTNSPVEKIRCWEQYASGGLFPYIEDAVKRECYLTLNVATDADIASINNSISTSISNLNSALTNKIDILEQSSNAKINTMESRISLAAFKKIDDLLTTESVGGMKTDTAEKLQALIRKLIQEEIQKIQESK